MKKFLKSRKAKGFTLVELLIVLIIIGILAGALLLVAGAGTDKANATKVVSNLRSAKAAALMAYADANGNWSPVSTDAMRAYMDAGVDAEKVTVTSSDSGAVIWVQYVDTGLSTGTQEKIKTLRDPGGVPLYSATDGTSYDSGTTILMRVN